MAFHLLPNKKNVICRFPSFHSFQFVNFEYFSYRYGFLLHVFWFFENVFIGYVDTFNGRNIVFDSLVKLKWRVYCQKCRFYFSEDNILHGPANTIHWTFRSVRRRKTECDQNWAAQPSLQTTTLVYFIALTLSNSSITFFKHVMAAIWL